MDENSELKSYSLFRRIKIAYHKLFSDRRRYLRKKLKIKVTEKISNLFEYFLSINISIGGMFLKSERPFAVGTDLDVEFSLPGRVEPIRAKARVVRTSPPVYRDGFCPGMGIAFTQLSDEDRRAIEAFVSKPGVY